MPQQGTLTFGQFQQNMAGLKRRMAQTQGEAQQILSDVQSQTMEQVFQMVQGLFNSMAQKDQEIIKLKENIEKCYNAHPELKIAEEITAKEIAAKKTLKAKKV